MPGRDKLLVTGNLLPASSDTMERWLLVEPVGVPCPVLS